MPFLYISFLYVLYKDKKISSQEPNIYSMLTVRKDLFQAKQQNISKAFTSILLFIISYKSSLFLILFLQRKHSNILQSSQLKHIKFSPRIPFIVTVQLSRREKMFPDSISQIQMRSHVGFVILVTSVAMLVTSCLLFSGERCGVYPDTKDEKCRKLEFSKSEVSC